MFQTDCGSLLATHIFYCSQIVSRGTEIKPHLFCCTMLINKQQQIGVGSLLSLRL